MSKHEKRMRSQLELRDINLDENRNKKRNKLKQNAKMPRYKQSWQVEGTSLTVENFEDIKDGTVFTSTV